MTTTISSSSDPERHAAQCRVPCRYPQLKKSFPETVIPDIHSQRWVKPAKEILIETERMGTLTNRSVAACA